MRIAYIITSPRDCGPTKLLQTLCKVMIVHGHDCRVYCLKEKEGVDFGCQTEFISFKKGFDFGAYDVVHSHGLLPNLYILIHKPFITKARCVSTLHSNVFEDMRYAFGAFKGFLMACLFLLSVLRHDKLICLGQNGYNYYSRWFSKKKLVVGFNAIMLDKQLKPDEADQEKIKAFKKDKILIGSHQPLLEIKGIDILIDAMKLLPEQYRLVIVGDGPLQTKLKKRIQELGIEERVLMIGYRKDASRYLSLYDIFALTSRNEGFSLSLLEAAHYGKKCVCSDLPTLREFYKDNVLYFELPSAHSLAQTIEQAASEKETYLGERLRSMALENYNLERFYQKHMEVYCIG